MCASSTTTLGSSPSFSVGHSQNSKNNFVQYLLMMYLCVYLYICLCVFVYVSVCLFRFPSSLSLFLVFASVGGMYVFLSTLLNFITRSAVMLSDSLFSFVRHETRTHIDRFTYSLKVRKSEARSLIRDHSSHATDSSSDSDSDHVTVQSGRLLSAAHPPTNPEHKD